MTGNSGFDIYQADITVCTGYLRNGSLLNMVSLNISRKNHQRRICYAGRFYFAVMSISFYRRWEDRIYLEILLQRILSDFLDREQLEIRVITNHKTHSYT